MTREPSDWHRHFTALSSPVAGDGIARRRFLQGMLATGAVMATPGLGGFELASAEPLGANDRILVVVLMGGGNDGFSMAVPADDGRYRDARRNLAIDPSQAIPFAPGLYWNNELSDINARYAAGDVAVVQGVGDPFDDRSHFSSMARWMRGTSDPAPLGFTGWLGRWLDGAGLGGLGAISVGDSGVPLHMRGANSKVTALPTGGNLYGARQEDWIQPSYTALTSLRDGTSGNPWYSTVATSVADSIDTAAFVSPIYTDDLPEEGLERDLALAATTINLDIGARILTVAFGDFDTHDDHRPRHQSLMAEFDAAVSEFFTRLDPRFADRVTMMTFSEFGRSWTANDSAGIDHGTTSTMLVLGSPVRGGLYGQAPDYSNFDDQGDLESIVDFRSYYASILDGWLGGGSGEILGGSYETMDFFSTEPSPPAGITERCRGVLATVVGTNGRDEITGTGARDVIVSLDGDDVIYGLGGDDLICAGEGADVIWGGAGNDEIVSGGGHDIVHGGSGNDLISGNDGDDRIFGEADDDVVYGDAGNDTLHGNRGRDTLNGGDGDDRIFGYANDDAIAGEAGNDRLHGNFGSDTITGGPGDDRIFGYGDDDELRGGGGSDLIGGNRGDDSVFGGPGDDRLYGSDGADVISGGQGNDIVEGNSGSDQVYGNSGDDRLDGGIDTDTCVGGPGNDAEARCETGSP